MRRVDGRVQLAVEDLSIVAESSMLVKRRHRGEGLTASGTLELSAAVGMHPLVATEIGELGVGLEAHLTSEGFDAAVDVSMLLQTTGGGKGLPTLGAGVTPCPLVLRPDVAMQVAGVREALAAVLAGVHPVAIVNCLVLDQVRLPVESPVAFTAAVLLWRATVL